MPDHGSCCHDHDCGAEDCGAAFSLYEHIDVPKVRCLNELVQDSCQSLFRPWDQRALSWLPPDASVGVGSEGTVNGAPFPLRSAADDAELLLTIPLSGSATLRAFSVVGGPDGRTPARVRAFANRDDLDFAAVRDLPPLQEWDLADDPNGLLEYPMRPMLFSGVFSLTLHFQGTLEGALRGDDLDDCERQSEVRFLGLKGDFARRERRAVQAVYEARAMPKDHQVPEESRAADPTGAGALDGNHGFGF